MNVALKQLWAFLVKDFLSNILLSTLKDVALKFVEKTPWAVIMERLLTRVLVMCLKWLSSLSTNQLWVDTVNDFLTVLNQSGLKEALPIAPDEKNTRPAEKVNVNPEDVKLE